ncbi:L-seryl-tRNA(Sec) selenium transferase [Lentzea waywayandensis]|uniref:L-seryl-tRNA(Sec) selenium transferase n=1 Tax=Lentzea waywayandensis TaxID=84724 RepID=A0A1I6CRE3_9PSEU|nr:L-seryl-tRNA(Sec) selenium transferase [Lentzea waywayandensis]SFQ95786.1 L-seryl-tRNA(Sec) selenium transferase [Lentzea waywayandensis]
MARRTIPSTGALLASSPLREAVAVHGRAAVKSAIHAAQEEARGGRLSSAEVSQAAMASLAGLAARPVLNATGVLIHTNLGRAPLSAAARAALAAAAGWTDVEFDLVTGHRAPRGRGALVALCDAVPDAGAAHVVNNNAAALLLCALALAPGREIVISRGELVEIGDGFRIPELLTAGGARLREVGTTNRTTARDYAAAIGPDTGFVLKVHPSNFRVEGFTSAASVAELAGCGVPVVVDIGSGLLAPDPRLPDEPDATTALRCGAALVTASADKLLGGPQGGLLLGDRDIVTSLRRHPAARALRAGKLVLAALEATLRGPESPVAVMLSADAASMQRRAHALASAVDGAEVVATTSVVGGGAAPGVRLPSFAVALPERFAAALRAERVVGRVEGGRCLLDLRTVDPADDDALARAVLAAGDPPCR